MELPFSLPVPPMLAKLARELPRVSVSTSRMGRLHGDLFAAALDEHDGLPRD